MKKVWSGCAWAVRVNRDDSMKRTFPRAAAAVAAVSLMAITGEADGPPMKTGAAVADFLGGTHLCAGLLAAIEEAAARMREADAARQETK